MKQFCYLGDVLECGRGSEKAIRARVGTAWGKWKEIASLLVNRSVPLHHCGKVYEACIRSVMLYGGETWALTARLEGILLSCDRRMLRYTAGVTWRDHVRSAEVARRCGVRELGDALRVRRLGWFGHVVRRGRQRSWERLGVLWCRGGGHLEDLKRPGEEICKNLQV